LPDDRPTIEHPLAEADRVSAVPAGRGRCLAAPRFCSLFSTRSGDGVRVAGTVDVDVVDRLSADVATEPPRLIPVSRASTAIVPPPG
jgi:hypothetical protein